MSEKKRKEKKVVGTCPRTASHLLSLINCPRGIKLYLQLYLNYRPHQTSSWEADNNNNLLCSLNFHRFVTHDKYHN